MEPEENIIVEGGEPQVFTEIQADPGDPEVEAAFAYVKAAVEERGLNLRDAHGAFVYQLASRGWRYADGAADSEAKTHPYLCHWTRLPKEDRAALAAALAPTEE
jgi:hypothetical protein